MDQDENTYNPDIDRPPLGLDAQPVMFIKKWDFAADPDPFVNTDQEGLPAQGNPDPRSVFKDHCIVKYNGEYYDPSYGIEKKATKTAYEDAVIAGFGANVGFDSNNIEVNWFERSNVVGTLETTIDP